MGIVPGPLVTGPESLRTRYGLFTPSIGPLDLPMPHGRGGGVRYVPKTCGVATPYPIVCEAGAIQDAEKFLDVFDTTVEALPFAVYASLECGSVGYTSSEIDQFARERLDDGEQGAVETAFWTGQGPTGTLEINSLAETAADITAGDDTSIVSVVATLEDELYRVNEYGHIGFIHAPVRVAAYAAAQHLVVDDRGIKRTPYGSVWVFGGGYPGTTDTGGPPAGGSYMHITGQVAVWRSPDVHVFPADDVFDRTANQRLMIAEREFAVAYDCHNERILFNPLGGS